MFIFICNKKQVRNSPYSLSLKLVIIGAFTLLISGLSDFWWHNTFGFDGFLSPTHLMFGFTLSTLMLGSVIGLIKMTKEFHVGKYFVVTPFLVIVFAGIWLMVSGIIHSVISPFSKGEIFDFTPDPYVAVTIGIISMPFLSSMIFWSISKTYNHFGVATIVVLLILLISIMTGIIPVDGLEVYLSWFTIPMIGAMIADYILHNKKYKIFQSHSEKIAGAIIGAISFMFYFPWIGPTYLRLYVTDDINTFDILPSAELTIAEVWLLISIPCAIIGMIGMMLAKKKLKLVSIS